VTLENSAGGARFVIDLPVVAGQDAVENGGKTRGVAAIVRVPSRRIMVVEDEPTIAQLVVDVLREEGHHVDAVLDSQEGLAQISHASYDLVICDLRMPRLDGPAFYDSLVRSGSPLADRIIFITGDTLAPRTAQFLQVSGLPFLAKPFLVQELMLVVNQKLRAIHDADGGEATDGAKTEKARTMSRKA
jgi:CheY-like chemotaxis protein